MAEDLAQIPAAAATATHGQAESGIPSAAPGVKRETLGKNAGDAAEPLITGFCYYRITFDQPNKPRKLKGLFGAADEPVKTKEYSSEATVKAFKAYVYAIRNEVAEMAPAGWKLDNVEGSAVIEKLSNQNLSPLDFI